MVRTIYIKGNGPYNIVENHGGIFHPLKNGLRDIDAVVKYFDSKEKAVVELKNRKKLGIVLDDASEGSRLVSALKKISFKKLNISSA